VFGQGKSAPLIAMAHEIPYVATATVAELRDLEAKVQTAMGLRGARYLHVFVPCPLGWGSASKDTIRIARLAKESGIFPVFEARDGELCGVSEIRRQVPVEEYLRPQKRFAHLFEPELHSETIARIQAGADRNIRRFGLVPSASRSSNPNNDVLVGACGLASQEEDDPGIRAKRAGVDGQALRDHVGRRLEPCQQDGLLAAGAARVCAQAAAVQSRLLGRRVVIYGGGSTAMDAARTAKRLGASDAIVVYRRTRERMPAHDFEVEEALQEGVMMKWLSTIKHVDQGKLLLERMELDETGFPQPTGETEELQADSLVLALGQEADLSLLDGVPGLQVEDGVIQVDERTMTGREGIFAGGDMVPAERTVTVGIGHGKQAARNIDAWLAGSEFTHPAVGELADFSTLNIWYYSDAPPTVAPRLDLIRRRSTFDEVTQGLDESNALFEARRCLSCGNCFGCDNCYGVCPDNAVLKVDEGDGYAFDLDYCKGCGICVQECPCGAIEMIPEEI
jgi:Pyruvate/2-oxoacid:ferredoxin oxidoreductase delta subunit